MTEKEVGVGNIGASTIEDYSKSLTEQCSVNPETS